MKYTKQPISIATQISLLKDRGLIFEDEERAAHYLSNISYYRLRAYTYPFQDNEGKTHPFKKRVTFEEILKLYVFDRQLRLLLFNAIEKIEIALRTQIIHEYAIDHGAFWHLNAGLYNNHIRFAEDIATLTKEINRSKETFIEHYKATYTDPSEPPAWMALEVTSMGLLSKIFANLRSDKACKDRITAHFGLKDVDMLANWMRCFSLIRNICAHHSRVWNRRMTKLSLPKKPVFQFIENKNIYPYKVYAYICCMQYILNIISPNHSFRDRIIDLMNKCPLLQEKEMGFPKDWQKEKIWQKI
jgi:abortive infection bacteriophage resistance protein